jgi:protein-disulfide isomerase
MLLFNGQRHWGASSSPREIWAKYAAAAGADMGKWRSCMNARTYQSAVEADRKLGLRMGVNATPTIFVGSRKIVGAVPFRDLAAAVRAQMN